MKFLDVLEFCEYNRSGIISFNIMATWSKVGESEVLHLSFYLSI
jgi:hypothetical protein